MTKRKSTPPTEVLFRPKDVDIETVRAVIKSGNDNRVVALLDQMEVAKQQLYTAAKAEAPIPVPDVLARACVGEDDVLLIVWRAWDIYAVHTADGWMTRADRVR